jgi:hypothetical protein
MADIVDDTGLQNSAATLLRRIEGSDGEPITRASISSISYEVWRTLGGPAVEVVNETALDKNVVIFDTLQLDARWTVDAVGYNFRFELPGTALPVAADNTQIDVKITPVTGNPFLVPFQILPTATFHDGP